MEQATLPGRAGFEPLVEETQELYVSYEAPRGLVDETWRHFSDKALDAQGRSQTLKHVYKEIEILLK